MQVTIGDLTQHDYDSEEVNHILDGSKKLNMKHKFYLRLFVKHLSEKPMTRLGTSFKDQLF